MVSVSRYKGLQQSLLYTPPSILNTNFQDPCENVECPAHQECRASFDGASARCACKGPCSGDSGSGDSVVCGSDGENYPSLCHLGNLKASLLLVGHLILNFALKVSLII